MEVPQTNGLKTTLLEAERSKRHALVKNIEPILLQRTDFIETLKRVYDLERIVGKYPFGTANARGPLQLKQTLSYQS